MTSFNHEELVYVCNGSMNANLLLGTPARYVRMVTTEEIYVLLDNCGEREKPLLRGKIFHVVRTTTGSQGWANALGFDGGFYVICEDSLLKRNALVNLYETTENSKKTIALGETMDSVYSFMVNRGNIRGLSLENHTGRQHVQKVVAKKFTKLGLPTRRRKRLI